LKQSLPAAEKKNMSNQASIQDEFLQALRDANTPASVYLINGIRLSGQVASFDTHVVVLESSAGRQLIFKHAIATLVPGILRRVLRSTADEAGECAAL
jgi:host factor-I protein